MIESRLRCKCRTSPFEPESYKDFLKKTNELKEKKLKEHIEAGGQEYNFIYNIRTDKTEWEKIERNKKNNIWRINRSKEEIDFLILKRCRMSPRKTPNAILCNSKTAKLQLISLWLEEMKE
ncbi:hypothetical protein OAM96_05730 [Candidatus Poseidoniaceae archaeon]|nr:hypothetical protein [Candidatus Poseidoniaceae archaeon]